jgi:hypothetical protein
MSAARFRIAAAARGGFLTDEGFASAKEYEIFRSV